MSISLTRLVFLTAMTTGGLPTLWGREAPRYLSHAPVIEAPIVEDTTTADTGRMAPPSLDVPVWLNRSDQAPPVRFGDGNVYVLGFTMYWCEACPSTYGALKDIAQRYGARGVRVLLVTSVGEKDLTFVQKYFASDHVTLPIAVGDTNEKAFKAFHVTQFPTTIVIDQHGVIRRRWTGGSEVPVFTSAGLTLQPVSADSVNVVYERKIIAPLDSLLNIPNSHL